MTHKALEEYFHKIINQPRIIEFKEPTMFERSKAYWQSVKETWSSLYTWEKPVEEPNLANMIYFYAKDFEGTWSELLDEIIDVIEVAYEYPIKHRVYYSVDFPLNLEEFSTKGRELNDNILQQLLLAFPEVYESSKQSKNVFE